MNEISILETTVKGLIKFPNKMVIRENYENNLTVFDVFVESSDIGRLIGKNGATILAIKNIVTSESTKHIRLNINDFAEMPE